MNKARRKQINEIIDELRELLDRVVDVLSEEEEAFGNLPETFQETDKGQIIQSAIDNLSEAHSCLDSCIESLLLSVE